jgi:hypothetical protein
MLACLYTDAILHYQEERVCLSKHLIKENKLFIVFFFYLKSENSNVGVIKRFSFHFIIWAIVLATKAEKFPSSSEKYFATLQGPSQS